MKKILSIIGICGLSTTAITGVVVLVNIPNFNTDPDHNDNIDIKVGNGSVYDMGTAFYDSSTTVDKLFEEDITKAAVLILKDKDVTIEYAKNIFDKVSIINVKNGSEICDQDVSGENGAGELQMNVVIKTNEASAKLGLTGEMNFNYVMNFQILDLSNSRLTNYKLEKGKEPENAWSGVTSLLGIIEKGNELIFDEVTRDKSIMRDTPYQKCRIDNQTERPIFIKGTTSMFSLDMLNKMADKETKELTYSYYATDEGKVKGIYNSTMVSITFTKVSAPQI